MGEWKKPARFQREERRKYRRIATDQVISFAPVAERDLLGVGRDVSSGGIRFEAVGCEIDLGDVLRVTFNIGERTVVATGRVVWSTDLDGISTDVGIEFVEIDPDVQRMLEELSNEAEFA
jgi:c-di-GMP-binding flagellar brake protein YcgR